MGRRLAVAVTLVVTGAVLGATVLREPLAHAAATVPSFFVTNDSAHPVPVREQNLDPSGNIKVHEQGTAAVHELGTANVNVTNGSIPVTGTVSVSGANMRVILVLQNETIPKNTAWHSGWLDTSDCKSMATFIDTGTTSYSDIASDLLLSVNGGRIGDSLGDVPGIRPNNEGIFYYTSTGGVPFFSPKSEVEIVNVDDTSEHTLAAAYLICQH
jgi:hypothetical protein